MACFSLPSCNPSSTLLPPRSEPVDSLLPCVLEMEGLNVARPVEGLGRKRPTNFGTRGSEAQMMAVVISAILAKQFHQQRK